MKFAAIDIGSNAIRLLFCNVFEVNKTITFKKTSLIRVPLRLGTDVFNTGEISSKNSKRLLKTMFAFKNLIDVHDDVISYRACATSAMRDAKNGAELVAQIKELTDIAIEVVSGDKEADIISANHIEDHLDADKNYLYIDVGGGSTELTFIENKKVVASHSFNVGTIRLLQSNGLTPVYEEMKLWIKKNVHAGEDGLQAIGSGGNINKIATMIAKKEGKPLHIDDILSNYNLLISYTFEERVRLLGLNEDRADVILPASEIFINVMHYAHIKKIIVPKIGVVDGIVHLLYEEYKAKLTPTLI
ncbi:MAG: exopolyphosphatase [Bacteroidia bacterium]|jgi:exopolyphosphatase/guanosine-5'-triphosphate,3'-diphosphate pyrophosphatase